MDVRIDAFGETCDVIMAPSGEVGHCSRALECENERESVGANA
jgi:hypothetical protein